MLVTNRKVVFQNKGSSYCSTLSHKGGRKRLFFIRKTSVTYCYGVDNIS